MWEGSPTINHWFGNSQLQKGLAAHGQHRARCTADHLSRSGPRKVQCVGHSSRLLDPHHDQVCVSLPSDAQDSLCREVEAHHKFGVAPGFGWHQLFQLFPSVPLHGVFVLIDGDECRVFSTSMCMAVRDMM